MYQDELSSIKNLNTIGQSFKKSAVFLCKKGVRVMNKIEKESIHFAVIWITINYDQIKNFYLKGLG